MNDLLKIDLVNVVCESLSELVDLGDHACVKVEVVHLDQDAADDFGFDDLFDDDFVLGLLSQHLPDFLNQWFAHLLCGGECYRLDVVEIVVKLDKFLADGVQSGLSLLLDDDVEEYEGCFTDEVLKHIGENGVFLCRWNNRAVQNDLQFGILLQCASDGKQVVLDGFKLLFLLGEVE